MEKKKVSRFEYVFVQAAAKDGHLNIEEYEQYTEEEERQQREDNIKQQLENILNRDLAAIPAVNKALSIKSKDHGGF